MFNSLGRECLILLHTQTLVVILLFIYVPFPMMTPWIVKKQTQYMCLKRQLWSSNPICSCHEQLFILLIYHSALDVWTYVVCLGTIIGQLMPSLRIFCNKDGFSQEWTRTGLAEDRQTKMKVFAISDHVKKWANSTALSEPLFVNPDPICL